MLLAVLTGDSLIASAMSRIQPEFAAVSRIFGGVSNSCAMMWLVDCIP
ncbi:hypothetical protein [Paracidovorax valerianellae]|nr:hypothetical protein [Paracidovorax valerianellae]